MRIISYFKDSRGKPTTQTAGKDSKIQVKCLI